MNVTEAPLWNETLTTMGPGSGGGGATAYTNFLRSFVWYSTFGVVYTINLFFTFLSSIYLIAVPTCFPRTMRLWLIPISLVDIIGTGINGMRLMFDRSYPMLRLYSPGLARCRTMNVVISSSEDLACFFLLGLSIERVIFVLKPLRASSIVTPLKVKIALVSITVYDLIVHTVWAILTYQKTNARNLCMTSPVAVWRTPFRLALLKLPFFVISIGSSIILFRAVLSSAKIRAKMSKTDEGAANLKREMRLGLMLLLMNCSFIFFQLPRDVMQGVFEIQKRQNIYLFGLPRRTAYFLYTVAILNVRVSNAINWIFYCGISSKFWEWYRKILCPCLKPLKKQPQRASTMVSSNASSG